MASFRYEPTSRRATYDEIMNSEATQAACLAVADKVAARVDGAYADVRPGKHRAHARATVAHKKVDSFRAKGHNRRVDLELQTALNGLQSP